MKEVKGENLEIQKSAITVQIPDHRSEALSCRSTSFTSRMGSYFLPPAIMYVLVPVLFSVPQTYLFSSPGAILLHTALAMGDSY